MAGSWMSMMPFYPTRYFAGFTLLLILSALVCYLRPIAGIALLAFAGIFFGNHPGGRFVEVYNLALVMGAIAAALTVSRRKGQILSADNQGPPLAENKERFPLPAVALILVLISYCGSYYLLESFEGYKIHPYHFLSARDWLPHYSVLIGVLTVSMAYSVWHSMRTMQNMRSTQNVQNAQGIQSVQNLQEGHVMPMGAAGLLLLGPALILLIALVESFLPGAAEWLDRWHIRIGGYVNRDHPHFTFSNTLSPALQTSPNALFWNRSWLSVYLISSLPVLGIALQMLPGSAFIRRILSGAFLMGITYVQLTVGSRAGLGAMAVFFAILLALHFSILRKPFFLWSAVLALALFAVAVPIMAFADVEPINSVLGIRGELFRSAVELAGIFPLTGGGAESFGFWNDMLLRAQGYQRIYSSSHNFLLQILVGFGMVGLLATFLLYGLAFRNLIRTISHEPQTSDTVLTPGIVLAGLMAVIFYGSFQEWWYIRVVHLHWWIGLLGAWLLWRQSPAVTRPSLRPWPRRLIMAFAFLAVAFQTYSGFTLDERHPMFENVGHLEKTPARESDAEEAPNHTKQGHGHEHYDSAHSHTAGHSGTNAEFRYPLLVGDGSLIVEEEEEKTIKQFRCQAPEESLTGPPDPRIICKYEPVERENVVERIRE